MTLKSAWKENSPYLWSKGILQILLQMINLYVYIYFK